MSSFECSEPTRFFNFARRLAAWATLAAGLASSTGCGAHDDSLENDVRSGEIDISSRTQGLYPHTGTLWPANSDGIARIAVCFSNIDPSTQYSTEVGWMQKALIETWDNNYKVDFNFLGKCTGTERSVVKVAIRDTEDGVYAEWLGYRPGTVNAKVVLNFTFRNWRKWCNDTVSERSQCIKALAIHEFGHVLGFSHEQNRSDAALDCEFEPQDRSGDGNLELGDYDPWSVMNYCKGDKLALSATDRRGMARLYGAMGGTHVVNAATVSEQIEYGDEVALRTFSGDFVDYSWLLAATIRGGSNRNTLKIIDPAFGKSDGADVKYDTDVIALKRGDYYMSATGPAGASSGSMSWTKTLDNNSKFKLVKNMAVGKLVFQGDSGRDGVVTVADTFYLVSLSARQLHAYKDVNDFDRVGWRSQGFFDAPPSSLDGLMYFLGDFNRIPVDFQ